MNLRQLKIGTFSNKFVLGRVIALAFLFSLTQQAIAQTPKELATLLRKLDESKGESAEVKRVAVEIVERKFDVSSVIGAYAARNIARSSQELGKLATREDWSGNRLPQVDFKSDEGVQAFSEFVRKSTGRESTFGQNVAKYIADSKESPEEAVTQLLAGTVKNYSVEAVKARAERNVKKWPFPFCLPNCED